MTKMLVGAAFGIYFAEHVLPLLTSTWMYWAP